MTNKAKSAWSAKQSQYFGRKRACVRGFWEGFVERKGVIGFDSRMRARFGFRFRVDRVLLNIIILFSRYHYRS